MTDHMVGLRIRPKRPPDGAFLVSCWMHGEVKRCWIRFPPPIMWTRKDMEETKSYCYQAALEGWR